VVRQLDNDQLAAKPASLAYFHGDPKPILCSGDGNTSQKSGFAEWVTFNACGADSDYWRLPCDIS